MAVVQISRIQVRRGQENQTGIPQLASGEMAWAIDTQKLYIGNGAVSDGAPAVGNTRILTINDNLIDLVGGYQFERDDANIQTGIDVNQPVSQTIQDVLDQIVRANYFGVAGNGTANDTVAIQRAVNQLFLNTARRITPPSLNETGTLVNKRVELVFGPGQYLITSTIYLPSFVTIKGAGINKTVFNYTGTGSAFEFINDTSSVGTYKTMADIEYNYQPRNVSLKDFSIKIGNTATGIKFNAVRHSEFENIEVLGTWKSSDGDQPNSIGLGLYAFSAAVTCQKNTFKNISVKGTCYGMWARQDIFNNIFDSNSFVNHRFGIAFGIDSAPSTFGSTGFQYGPRKNIITNSTFDSIERNGIIVSNGTGNKSRGNTFIEVGNNVSIGGGVGGTNSGGGNTNSTYSHIKFVVDGNSSVQDSFDRTREMAINNWTSNYIPEIEGFTSWTNTEPIKISIGQANSATKAFRFPVTKATSITVNYVHKSTAFQQMRKGTLNISVDLVNSTVQLTDEYEYNGSSPIDSGDQNLVFSAFVELNNSVVVYYNNYNINDTSTIVFTHAITS